MGRCSSDRPGIAGGVACSLLAGWLLAGCAGTARLADAGAPSVFEQLIEADNSPAKPHPLHGHGGRSRHANVAPGWATKTREYFGDDAVVHDTVVHDAAVDHTAAYGGGARGTATGTAKASPEGGGYRLEFNDAELADVAKVILRDTLKMPYVFDARVKGRVTVSAARAVAPGDLLALLESILAMNRAVMIRKGKQVKIVPAATVRSGGGAVSYGDEARRAGPGYGITLVPLEHVSAAAMRAMLRSFVARPGALRAQSVANVLLIRGTAAERATLADVATSFDVDWLAGQSTGIYKLAHANPAEMIGELTELFRLQRGGPGADMVRFSPVRRLNAVLVIAKRASMLAQAGRWIRRLDKSDPRARNVYVYRVENAKAADLAALLNETFGATSGQATSGSGSATSSLAGSRSVFRADDGTASDSANGGVDAKPLSGSPLGGAAGDAPFATASTAPGAFDFTGNSARAGSAGGSAGGIGGSPPAVLVVADEVSNKLIIRAGRRDYERILHILHRLDRPPVQVLINVTLAEVTLNDNLRYGVQAFLQQTTKGPNNGVLGFSTGEALAIAPSVPGLNFIMGLPGVTPKIILDALSARTSVRLVSSPSVVVVDNHTATLQVGEDVPIATRQAVSVTDPAAPIVNSITFRKTGVILRVTPRVNSDGLVTMQVEQEISAVVSADTAGATGSLTPTISQRRVSSLISVYSGQMVVLGGLVSERRDRFKNGLPGLNRVPILRHAIGKTDNRGARTELVVFIQPRVIKDAADATRIADELRERLNALAPKERHRRRRERHRERRGAAIRHTGSDSDSYK